MSSVLPKINNSQFNTNSHSYKQPEVGDLSKDIGFRDEDEKCGKIKGTSCVIGHGRNCNPIEELNYAKTTFIDLWAGAGPDIVANFDSFVVNDDTVKYDNIILLCSHLLKTNEISKITGTYISDNCLGKCLKMMKPTSYLFSRNIYSSWLMCECYRDDREFYFIQMMLPIFTFEGITQFSDSPERLIVFKRRTESIPSRIFLLGEMGVAAIKLKQMRVANSKDCCGKLIDEPNSQCTKKINQHKSKRAQDKNEDSNRRVNIFTHNCNHFSFE